jgi:hypothetical protein
VLAYAPRKHEIAPHLLADLAACDLHHFPVVDVPVAVLDEHAAQHALEVALAAGEAAALAVAQDADVFLATQSLERPRLVIGRKEHVDEPFRQRLAKARAHRTVNGADHPECRDRIGRERTLVRLLERCRNRDTAGIGVLDDDARR